jgi:hypothetical protein
MDDFYQQLDNANTQLGQIKSSVDSVHSAVNQINATLTAGFQRLIVLGQYANQAAWHNSKQNDTIICILEHIAKNTCELLNESVMQTALQTSMEGNLAALSEMYATVHAQAALERQRLQNLKSQVEKCCPPPVQEPPCHYEPCPAPPPLGEPPRVGGPAGSPG